MSDLLLQATFVAATFLLAGVVKGMIGLGLPTISMGLLGLVMAPSQAAALLLVPSLVTNVWQLLAGSGCGALLRRLWGMMLGICLGTAAGSGIIAGGDTRLATAGLGGALILYALVGLARARLRVPAWAERRAGPVVGAVTGLITGATGVFVIPAVPFLGALGLERDELVQALGLSFTVSTLALAAGLAWHGAVPAASLGLSLLALAPALLGMAAGGWLRARVSLGAFRRCFFLGLLGLGGEIAWRALA
ncbi:putative membrane transporter protein [Rhodovastum atsumiense]|uniref:Probable membrane transporter protein n=1 Tax=Rhodovastum atsumiense TaxID=504468 RepID=A0A5M6IZ50_9PROT|nr:sulfite exporter TauE/SafE family protein [Rhodovastum atsumiense]KAA5613229.1 sulfite exporter TauE/SafE family protein [Rhodovastum atsumiense]CAH2600616.1 putative membrane transporter protein [Rhodovastum atsumiense]